jgi:hypothetical protein
MPVGIVMPVQNHVLLREAGTSAVTRQLPRPSLHQGSVPRPADLAQSLVYSGALALGLAGSGLVLVGFRRQLW